MNTLQYRVVDGGVEVTRVSPHSRKLNTMVLPITEQRLRDFCAGNLQGLIQDIFPELTQFQREFLQTGFTEEDWDEVFANENE